MTRIRLVQRRKKMIAARLAAEKRVAAAVAPVFKRQRKVLDRYLRKANLRKRLSKIDTVGDTINEVSSYKIGVLMKDGVAPDDWQNWKAMLVDALTSSLAIEVIVLAAIENLVWTSRGYSDLTFDPTDLIYSMQLRTGNMLGDLADSTVQGVEKELVGWYMSDEPFSALMDRLDKWFDENRAAVISEIEVGELISQIVFQAMASHGWGHWFWDAQGENPCEVPLVVLGIEYAGCRELHGKRFGVGAPMPPSAAHPRCHCLPVPDMD